METTESSNQFYLECALQYGAIVRMAFSSKEAADEAQTRISEGMSKGKYQSEDVIHIESDTSTYDIRASEVMSVSTNDQFAWFHKEKAQREYREAIGLPNSDPA